MRTFLSEENLKKAAVMAVVVTVMSVGRLVQAGVPMAFFLTATFFSMMLVCGVVAAWSATAGMPGMVADRQTLWRGLAIAAALMVVMIPVRLFWLNPILHGALLNAQSSELARLSYPETTAGRVSLLLWSAGFQFLCMQAAPMSIAARLTGRRSVAVGICVAFRAYVVYRQILAGGITDGVTLFVALALIGATVQCMMFATFGLIPAMVLAGGMDLHLFFGVP